MENMGFYEDLQNVVLSQIGPDKQYENMNRLAAALGMSSTDLKRAVGVDETRENRSIKRLAKILDGLEHTIAPRGQAVGEKQLERLRNEIAARVTEACLSSPIDPSLKIKIIAAATGAQIMDAVHESSQKAVGNS